MKIKKVLLLLLVFLIIFSSVFSLKSYAVSVPQLVIDQAVSLLGGNKNVVVLQKKSTGQYIVFKPYRYSQDVITNGNWCYRTHNGAKCITCPGWYVMDAYISPSWSSIQTNTVGSNSIFQVDNWEDYSVAYAYKDIINADGTIFCLATTNTVETPSGGGSTNVDYSQNGVFGWIGAFLQNILNALQGTLVSLNPSSDKFILKGFAEFFTSVGNFFSTLLDKLNPASDNFILKSIANFFVSIVSYINPFSDNFFGKKLIELFQGLLEFLFIPADDPFSVIKDTLTAKFGFIDEIKETVAFMQSLFVAPTEAPVINVNIDSKYYSGDAKVIDLSFFTKFKPISDTLITVFVYLLFIWRLFKNLPSIISGFSSITGGGDGQ